LRTPGDVAKAVTDIGLQTVDLTVMPYPGHVDPAKVKTDLPLFVNGLKMNGITVSAITCPITDADSPNAEAILGTASALGIRYYSWGGFRYDDRQAYQPQLDALKPRVSKLAKLNEKYGMRALYQPQAGAENVGAAFLIFSRCCGTSIRALSASGTIPAAFCKPRHKPSSCSCVSALLILAELP
jgi:hypothetical protein